MGRQILLILILQALAIFAEFCGIFADNKHAATTTSSKHNSSNCRTFFSRAFKVVCCVVFRGNLRHIITPMYSGCKQETGSTVGNITPAL